MANTNRPGAPRAANAPMGASDPASLKAAAEAADGHITPPPAVAAPLAGVAAAGIAADPLEAAREAQLVAMTADDSRPSTVLGYILIVSAQPGFRRAGLLHPSRAEYPLDFFTQLQLDLIDAEPKLTLVAVNGTPDPRHGAPYGATRPSQPEYDPLTVGRAAADAVSRGPNRAEPGLRNAQGTVMGTAGTTRI